MRDDSGAWIGWGLGDDDPKVADFKAFMRRKFASYAGHLNSTTVYDDELVAAVKEMQSRYRIPATGVINWATQVKMGYLKPEAPNNPVRPVVFSIEGHTAPWNAGPAADTARIIESEGHCWWQGVGYNNGALPFDNQSGVNELARMWGQPMLDSGRPFPLGTPWALVAYSQGGIVAYDAWRTLLQPGQVHAERAKDLRAVLVFSNPCRGTGSIAPWSVDIAGDYDSHGLDPYKRPGLPGNPPPPPAGLWADVWRRGDIFCEQWDDAKFALEAAVYEAIARGDFWSDPYSLTAQIADLFKVGFDKVWAIFQAIVHGGGFLLDGGGAPHYAPWPEHTMAGGIQWLKDRLADSATIAA